MRMTGRETAAARRGARSLVSADRPSHVDFSVKNWARGGVYV